MSLHTSILRLFSLIFIVSLFASCATDLEKIKKIAVIADSVSEAGEEVEIHYSEQGFLKAKITAPKMLTFQAEEPYTEFPDGVQLFFYDQQLNETSRLKANYGIYYTKIEEMMVKEDVVLVNQKNEQLNSEELIWKRREAKIFSEKFVKITTPDEILYGTGFEAKEDFSDYTIKNISGIIKVEDEKNP